MRHLEIPSVEYLNECFVLENDALIWKERPRHHFNSLRAFSMWNARFADKPAGRIMLQHKKYIQIGMDNRRFLAHRIIAKMIGVSTNREIDHIDGNGLNNSAENIRAASRSENMRNNPGWAKKGGISGVRWCRQKMKWQAYIRACGKLVHLGYFRDEQSAINARVEAEVIHYGSFAKVKWSEHVS